MHIATAIHTADFEDFVVVIIWVVIIVIGLIGKLVKSAKEALEKQRQANETPSRRKSPSSSQQQPTQAAAGPAWGESRGGASTPPPIPQGRQEQQVQAAAAKREQRRKQAREKLAQAAAKRKQLKDGRDERAYDEGTAYAAEIETPTDVFDKAAHGDNHYSRHVTNAYAAQRRKQKNRRGRSLQFLRRKRAARRAFVAREVLDRPRCFDI
jgi:type IV secretory pathway VirB10-like protein